MVKKKKSDVINMFEQEEDDMEHQTVIEVTASRCRIPPDVFNRVAYKNERIEVKRRDGKSVWIVSEDEIDAIDAFKAIRDMESSGQTPIPLGEVKRRILD